MSSHTETRTNPTPPAVRLSSGDLTCAIERDASGIHCTIARGATTDLAAARSRWIDGRVKTTTLSQGAPGEDRLAWDAAFRLARSARAQVTCYISLGKLEPDASRAASLEQAVCDLVTQAAEELEQSRLLASIADPAGLAARLNSREDGLEARVARLMRTPLEELRARHAPEIAAANARHFERRVVIFAPLYLSNACSNECVYCGFRKSASIERIKLSPEAALAEAHVLADQGHRSIDLVTGEIPTDPFVDYVCDVVTAIAEHTPIQRIHLNLGALTEAQLLRLRGAGAAAYHLYQETYDQPTYFRVHGTGPKRDMAHRLEASASALRAGFTSLGLGVLLGLGPIEEDLANLARHGHLLMREFPGVRLGFSLPRIQEAGQATDIVAGAHVEDEVFIKALLFLRLEFESAHLTLTTREAPRLRDSLMDLGITKLSAGVSTSPGGYANQQHRESKQFAVRDERSISEVAETIRASGFIPTFA